MNSPSFFPRKTWRRHYITSNYPAILQSSIDASLTTVKDIVDDNVIKLQCVERTELNIDDKKTLSSAFFSK